MEETKKTLKPLKDLNLMDRFLFAEATEDPFIMKSILEIILGKDIMLKHLPQSEKEMRTTPFNRFIKLDVWAWTWKILCIIRKCRRKTQTTSQSAAAIINP